jgi:HAE1 family hydrophobic/amphiphilic exporter-1
LAIASLVVNIFLLPFLGVEFQPTYDSGEFNITLTAPTGTSLDKMDELVEPIEETVLAIPELQSSFTMIGSGDRVNNASIGIKLIDGGKRSRSMNAIMDDLRLKFKNIGGLKVMISNGQGRGSGDSRPIQVALRGPDLETLNQLAYKLADNVKQITGTTDVDISSQQALPEIDVKLDNLRMSDAGVEASVDANTVQMAFLGKVTNNHYSIAGNDYDIRVQLNEKNRNNINDVANLRVAGSNSNFVRLGDIAKVTMSSGPTEIDRQSRQRQVIVYANTVGITPGEVIEKIKTIMLDFNLPLGYTYDFVGQAQMMQESFAEIGKALLLAVILIYMILAAQFESFIHPLTIMLSLPFSLVGAILGLLIAGNTINIISLIGVIMLMGLVTKNAILLVDYTNQLREQGLSVEAALIEAGSVRLRPILMTTMAIIFGMMPIALGIGSGSELRQSMGVVLIGGLITSTILTLLIVPLVYLLIDRRIKLRVPQKTQVSMNQ